MKPVLVVLSALICCALIVPVAAQQHPPPVWASEFSVVVNTTLHRGFDHDAYSVMHFYYDATNKQSRNDYGPGQADRYCRSVRSNSSESCTHIVNKDGWRYLQWPQSTDNYCCKCCNSASGCGIISPDWLKDATYVGEKTFDTRKCEGWYIKGSENNYYYQTIEQPPRPCVFYEGLSIDPRADYWDYQTETYKEGPQPQTLFQVPQNCNTRCLGLLCSLA